VSPSRITAGIPSRCSRILRASVTNGRSLSGSPMRARRPGARRLEQRPARRLDPPAAIRLRPAPGRSTPRGRPGRRTRRRASQRQGSKQTSAAGALVAGRHVDRARIEAVHRSPSSSRKACKSRHCGLPCPTRCRPFRWWPRRSGSPGSSARTPRQCRSPTRPRRRSSASLSATTRSTIRPRFSSRSAADGRSACWPSAGPGRPPRPRVRACGRAPGRAKGTASTLTLRSPGHLTRRSSASMKRRCPPRSRCRPRATAHGAPRPAGRSGRRLAAAAKADSHHHSPALERAPVTDASGVGSARTPTHPNPSGQRSDSGRPRDLPDRRRAMPKSPLERQLAPGSRGAHRSPRGSKLPPPPRTASPTKPLETGEAGSERGGSSWPGTGTFPGTTSATPPDRRTRRASSPLLGAGA
jgi:hypothetical protein